MPRSVCPRCLGNANAFAKFEINGGRCLLCNGVGASRSGPVGVRAGKPVTLAYVWPDGWVSRDPNVRGRYILSLSADAESVKAARIAGRGLKTAIKIAFDIVDGRVLYSQGVLGNCTVKHDLPSLMAALQAAYDAAE
jgi:hypothetical protein